MKRLLSLFIVLATCSIAYSQQDYFKHEVSLSYGFQPILSISDPVLPKGTLTYKLENKSNIGTLNVTYLYHFSKSFAIGGTYAYGNVKHDLSVLGDANDGLPPMTWGIYNSKYHLLMPTAKYEWLHKGLFYFYSRVAVGVYYTPKTDLDPPYDDFPSLSEMIPGGQKSRVALAWQVVPLGIELRFIKHFAFFVEGGAGSSGYGLAGVKAFF
jgi:hypothetical protein